MDKLVRQIFLSENPVFWGIFSIHGFACPSNLPNQTLHIYGWSHPIHGYLSNQTYSTQPITASSTVHYETILAVVAIAMLLLRAMYIKNQRSYNLRWKEYATKKMKPRLLLQSLSNARNDNHTVLCFFMAK